MKQVRVPWWIGAFQIQLQNSFFYMSVISQLMVSLTFWYTTGYKLAERFAPWFTIWMLYALLFVVVIAVILIDYKFLLPSRMAFNNKQSCSAENPAMDLMREMQSDLKKLKEKAGIE